MAKAKITITGSGKSDAYTPYAFLYINNTVYTSAQVVEVELGTVCQCRVGRGTTGVVAILLDGNPVKEVTDTYGEAIYELTVNRNYTIELGVATGATINITTGAEVASDDIHNSLISGTAREIESGTVLIGGVVREIESGLVMIGGVAREIEFTKPPVLITITGSGNTNRACVEINGTIFYSPATLEVVAGTEIILFVKGGRGTAGTITVDGTVAAKTDTNGGTITHSMPVTGDITVTLNASSSSTGVSHITVTTS